MTALVVPAALVGVVLLVSLLAGVLLIAAFVVGQARVWVGSRREMDRQLADLLKDGER